MARDAWGAGAWIGALCALAAMNGARAEPARLESRLERAPGPLRVWIETPDDGAMVASAEPSVFVAGRILSSHGVAGLFDLVLVLDRSKSTDAPAGVDVDGDGLVGRSPDSRYTDGASDDRGDSVLAAEIVAARTLLEQLDPATTRVALAVFSGDSDPETPDAEILAPLSSDYAGARLALDELLDEWPSGRTNLSAAIEVSSRELMGVSETGSEPRPDARKIVLLMTDGQPTLPIAFSSEANAEAAFASARLAAKGNIRIDVFAIGREANQNPGVAQGVAGLTGGQFTAVREPRDLVSTFEQLRLTEVAAVEAHNRSMGAQAEVVLLEADGRFAALLPLVPGENRLEIRARASSGRWTWRSLRVGLTAGGQLAPLHSRWLGQRTRLLERKLADLRRRELFIEASRQAADLDSLLDRSPRSSELPPARRTLEVIPEAAPAAPER